MLRFLFRWAKPPSQCPYCHGPVEYAAGRWWGTSCDHEGSY